MAIKFVLGRRSSSNEDASTTPSSNDSFRQRLAEFWIELKERFKENHLIQLIHRYLPPLNFITIHYLYFISLCLITSLIFWGSSDPAKSIGYTDSLFLVVSAMTEAGLNTINLSQMTTFQQVILFLLILVGSSIFVSIGTVVTRKRVFEGRFEGVVRAGKERGRGRGRGRGWSVGSRSMASVRGPENGNETPIFGVRGEKDNMEAMREGGNDREFEGRHSRPRDPTSIAGAGNIDTVISPPMEKSVDRLDVEVGTAAAAAAAVSSAQLDGHGNTNLSPAAAVGLGLGLEKHVGEGVVTAGGADSGEEPNPKTTVISPMVERDRITPMMQFAPSPAGSSAEHHRILSFVGVGAHPNSTSSAYRSPYTRGLSYRGAGSQAPTIKSSDLDAATQTQNLDRGQYPHYLTKHVTGRNAQFYGLSREEREDLGGVEYRAISLLAWVVPVYFCTWQFLGCVGLGAYMNANKPDVARENGINPWWLGVFNGVSAFNNSGMSLLDANMIPFQNSIYPLITMSLLILAGNTAYPLFLHIILSLLLKGLNFFFPDPTRYFAKKATLLFILRFPRRVYTNLFTLAPTLWLLFMLLALNGIDWIAFELLNIGNPAVSSIPANYRVLDGLFQAFAVRSGGFYIINISSLRIGLQVLYIIMMYISVYPVVITMRHSNVYEERSLGIYADDMSSDSDSDLEAQPPRLGSLYGTLKRTFTTTMEGMGGPFSSPATGPGRTGTGTQFIRQQVRGQLAHDLWWLVLAILFISCIEVSNFDRDPVTYSVFNIAFEVVSGYGCVGISTGLPDQAYSFSGGWHKASKIILCAVMLRGRHRGLPVALDRAVRLPSEEEGDGSREEEDFVLRRTRSRSLMEGGVGRTPVV